MNFGVTAVSLLTLLLLAVPGWILRKFNIVRKEIMRELSIILLYISQPFLLIASFQKAEYSEQVLVDMGYVLLLALCTVFIVSIIAYVIFHKRFKENYPNRLLTFASICGNYGFFGIPVLQILFPNKPEVIIYSTACLLVLNLFCWTIGAFLVSSDKKYVSVKKAIINPTVIAVVIALPMFATQTKLPTELLTVCDYIGNITTPLSMLVLGMRFSEVRLKDIFSNLKNYVAIIMKLLISPLIAYALLQIPMPISDMAHRCIVILMAMPPAIVTLTTVECFALPDIKDDLARQASNVVVVGTILSTLTIPLIALLP